MFSPFFQTFPIYPRSSVHHSRPFMKNKLKSCTTLCILPSTGSLNLSSIQVFLFSYIFRNWHSKFNFLQLPVKMKNSSHCFNVLLVVSCRILEQFSLKSAFGRSKAQPSLKTDQVIQVMFCQILNVSSKMETPPLLWATVTSATVLKILSVQSNSYELG